MHYLKAGEYTYLAGEINALYHEAAVKMGVSDSVQNILYVIREKGAGCSQSEISRPFGSWNKRGSPIWNRAEGAILSSA